MDKSLMFILFAALATLQLSEARSPGESFSYELQTEDNDDNDVTPEPEPNKACHCESATCTCCVKEFRKRICASLDFIEKVDEDSLLVQVNLTIDDRRVISQRFSTDDIPALCYQGMTGFTVCVKLNTRKEEELKLCTSLQFIYGRKLLKEVDLHCLKVPRGPNSIEYQDKMTSEELLALIASKIEQEYLN